MTNQYTDLIPSANASQPNFIAMVALVTQAFVDGQACLAQFDSAFDLDTAIGTQLDVLGLWIGLPRSINVPLTGDYFAFDIPGAGFDEAPWFQPGNPLFSSAVLDDDDYRQALRAKAAANEWDGSLYGAYEILNILFSGSRTSVIIHDYQDMTMAYEIVGVVPDAATLAILSQDYLGLRPEGVALFATILP